MERHIKWQSNGNLTQIVKPGTMRFLDFARLQLAKGEQYSASTGDREWVLDIFSGIASVTVEGPDGMKKEFKPAGARENVFAGPPTMIYMPPGSQYTITGVSEAFDAGLFSAASKAKTPATLVEGSEVVVNDAGRDNWRRKVYTGIGDNVKADRLIAGETVMEEIYFFRIRPSQGYGFIWTYTAPGDSEGFSTVFVVEDGDTVLLPKGYHPVVAAPGYDLHYTWVLAGEERRYGAWSDDPRHAWVKGQ